VNVVLTISTTAPTTASERPVGRSIFYAVGMLLPAISFVWAPTKYRKSKPASCSLMIILLLLMVLASCGGVSVGGGGGQNHPGTPPGSYTITVTGTSPGAPPDAGQSTQVILVVN
jgi:hypothetical protein